MVGQCTQERKVPNSKLGKPNTQFLVRGHAPRFFSILKTRDSGFSIIRKKDSGCKWRKWSNDVHPHFLSFSLMGKLKEWLRLARFYAKWSSFIFSLEFLLMSWIGSFRGLRILVLFKALRLRGTMLRMSHLQLINDTIFFSKAEVEDISNLKLTLKTFGLVLGLVHLMDLISFYTQSNMKGFLKPQKQEEIYQFFLTHITIYQDLNSTLKTIKNQK